MSHLTHMPMTSGSIPGLVTTLFSSPQGTRVAGNGPSLLPQDMLQEAPRLRRVQGRQVSPGLQAAHAQHSGQCPRILEQPCSPAGPGNPPSHRQPCLRAERAACALGGACTLEHPPLKMQRVTMPVNAAGQGQVVLLHSRRLRAQQVLLHHTGFRGRPALLAHVQQSLKACSSQDHSGIPTC